MTKISVKIINETDSTRNTVLQFERTQSLQDVRAQLVKEQLMKDGDVFLSDGFAVVKDSEAGTQIESLLATKDATELRLSIRTSAADLPPAMYSFQRKSEGGKRAFKLKPTLTLAEVRTALGAWLGTEDRFLGRDGSEIAVAEEGDWALKDIASAEGVVVVQDAVAAKPQEARPFTFTRSFDEESKSLKLKPEDTLAAARTALGAWIQKDDHFADKAGGKVAPDQEAGWTLGDVEAEKGGVRILSAKSGKPSVRPGQPGTPSFIDTTRRPPAWGLPDEGSPPDLLKELEVQLNGAEVEVPELFTSLSLEQVKALYTMLYLNRGLYIGPNPLDMEFTRRSDDAPVEYIHENRIMRSAPPNYSACSVTTATASRILNEFRQRSVHAAKASGSYAGCGIAAEFRHDLEKLQRQETTDIFLTNQTLVPKVVLLFDRESDLRCAPRFQAAVEKVFETYTSVPQQYEALHRDVFRKFGYFYPCRVTVGGKLQRSMVAKSNAKSDQESLLNEFNFAANGEFETDSGKAKFDVGYSYSDLSQSKHNTLMQLKEQQMISMGGSSSLALDPKDLAKWTGSVASVKFWAVINNADLVPVLCFLPDALAQRCATVIEEQARSAVTARYTVMDMTAFAQVISSKAFEALI